MARLNYGKRFNNWTITRVSYYPERRAIRSSKCVVPTEQGNSDAGTYNTFQGGTMASRIMSKSTAKATTTAKADTSKKGKNMKAQKTEETAAPQANANVVFATVTVDVPQGYFVSEFISKADIQTWAPAKSGNGLKAQVTFTRVDDGKKLWVTFWKKSMDSIEFSVLPGTKYDRTVGKAVPADDPNNKLNGRSWLGHRGKEWWTAHDSIVQMASNLLAQNS